MTVDYEFSAPKGPFKTRLVTVEGNVVCHMYTQGSNQWSVKARDGRLWDDGRGLKTHVRVFFTVNEAMKFIEKEWLM